MPEAQDATQHVKPYIQESLDAKALHFSISEIQSRMLLRDPDALDLEYTRTMMGFLLFNPTPRSIAMIGLGGGSLAKFCHRHLPATRLQVVEVNPHVIALRDEFHVPPDDARFSVMLGDGAQFVRLSTVRPDVLMVDGFDDQGQPPRLCSQRFYDDCADLLQPGGILVLNLHLGHLEHDRHLERVRRSFNDLVLFLNDADLSNCIVFARKGHTLHPGRPGRPARGSLGEAAWKQLKPTFARLQAALSTPAPPAAPASR